MDTCYRWRWLPVLVMLVLCMSPVLWHLLQAAPGSAAAGLSPAPRDTGHARGLNAAGEITVTGTVRNEEGEPLANVPVRIREEVQLSLGEFTFTDAAGVYTATVSVAPVPEIYNNRVLISVNEAESGVRLPGLEIIGDEPVGSVDNATNPIPATFSGVDFALRSSIIQVTGSVVDDATGAPIAGAEVTAETNTTAFLGTVTDTDTTTAEGSFTVEFDVGDVSPYSIFFTANAENYASGSEQIFSVSASDSPISLAEQLGRNIELAGRMVLRGTLLDDASNERLAGTADGELRLYDSTGTHVATEALPVTDASGQYTITFFTDFQGTPLLNGEYFLEFRNVYNDTVPINGFDYDDIYPRQFHNQGKLTSREANAITLIRGQTTEVQTRLAAGIRISGQLHTADTNGEPDRNRPLQGFSGTDFFQGATFFLDVYPPEGDTPFDTLQATYDGNGVYTTTRRLLPGAYRLRFSQVANHYNRFYNNKDFLGSADVVRLSDSASDSASGIDEALYQRVRIAGSVRSSAGELLQNICFDATFYDPDNPANTFSVVDIRVDDNGEYNRGVDAPDNPALIIAVRDFEVQFHSFRLYDAEAMRCTDTPAGYLPLWYDNASSQVDADVLQLPLGQLFVTSRVDLTLRQGMQVSGRVVDAADSSSGLENISVRLLLQDAQQPIQTRLTDATGAYRFDNVPPGAYRVQAVDLFGSYLGEFYNDKGSFATADSVNVRGDADVTLEDIALQQSRTLNVTAYDSNGVLAGPALQYKLVDATSGISVASTLNDSDGSHSFTLLRPGIYKLLVGSDVGTPESGPYPARWYTSTLDFALAAPIDLREGDQTITITLARNGGSGEGTLSGRVTRESTREPQAGVTVRLYEAFGGLALRTTRTDASGVYTFRQVPAGSYKLGFESALLIDEFYDNASMLQAASIIQVAGSEPVIRDAALANGGRIAVSVTAADTGLPVAGVSVIATSTQTGQCFPPAAAAPRTTGPDGTVILYGLPAGEYMLQTQASGPFLALEDPQRYTVTLNERTSAALQLARGGQIAGLVTDAETGLPIVGAEVELYRGDLNLQAGLLPDQPDAISDELGRYVINGIPFGSYKLAFAAPGYAAEFAVDSADWLGGEPFGVAGTQIIDAALAPRAMGILSGRVTLETTGQAAPGVLVRLYDAAMGNLVASTTTGTSGEYSLSSLEAASYLVQFLPPPSRSGFAAQWYNGQTSSDSAEPVPVQIGTPATGIDAVLRQAPGQIGGSVTASDTGEPLRGVGVTAFRADNGDEVGRDISDQSGTYTITGLLAGEYLLRVDSFGDYSGQWFAGKTRASADSITVADDAQQANIVLSKTGIAGRVTDSQGRGIAAIDIAFLRSGETDSPVVSVTTSASGYYTSTGMAAGSYLVLAVPPDALRDQPGFVSTWLGDTTERSAALDVTVGLSGFVQADITLLQGVSLSGTVVDAVNQQPLPNVTVQVAGRQTTTSATGSYTVTGIITGEHIIKTTAPAVGLASAYPEQWYNQARLADLAEIVPLTSSRRLTIPLALEPGDTPGSLRGVVVDARSPQRSLSDVEVELYQEGRSVPIASQRTGINGTYRFDGLRGGSYRLRLLPPQATEPASAYPVQWFNRVQSLRQAQSVNVALGATTMLSLPLTREPTGQFVTAAGGSVTSADGSITIDFPAGIFDELVNVHLTRVLSAELATLLPPVPPPANQVVLFYQVEARAASSGQVITQVNQLITTSVHYAPAELTGPPQISELMLEIIYWDSAAQEWVSATDAPPCRLAGCAQSINQEENIVQMQSDHLSLFALASSGRGGPIYLPIIQRK